MILFAALVHAVEDSGHLDVVLDGYGAARIEIEAGLGFVVPFEGDRALVDNASKRVLPLHPKFTLAGGGGVGAIDGAIDAVALERRGWQHDFAGKAHAREEKEKERHDCYCSETAATEFSSMSIPSPGRVGMT